MHSLSGPSPSSHPRPTHRSSVSGITAGYEQIKELVSKYDRPSSNKAETLVDILAICSEISQLESSTQFNPLQSPQDTPQKFRVLRAVYGEWQDLLENKEFPPLETVMAKHAPRRREKEFLRGKINFLQGEIEKNNEANKGRPSFARTLLVNKKKCLEEQLGKLEAQIKNLDELAESYDRIKLAEDEVTKEARSVFRREKLKIVETIARGVNAADEQKLGEIRRIRELLGELEAGTIRKEDCKKLLETLEGYERELIEKRLQDVTVEDLRSGINLPTKRRFLREQQLWKNLQSLQTMEEMRKEQQKNFAESMGLLVMEKDPHFQHLLKAAGLDVRKASTVAEKVEENACITDLRKFIADIEEEKKIFVGEERLRELITGKMRDPNFREAAKESLDHFATKEFVDLGVRRELNVQAREIIADVIKEELPFLARSVAALDEILGPAGALTEEEMSRGFEEAVREFDKIDIPALQKHLKVEKFVNKWHEVLEGIWIRRMPTEQREQLVAAPDRERGALANKLFNNWLSDKLGKHTPLKLSQEGIRIARSIETEDLSEEKIQKLQRVYAKRIQTGVRGLRRAPARAAEAAGAAGAAELTGAAAAARAAASGVGTARAAASGALRFTKPEVADRKERGEVTFRQDLLPKVPEAVFSQPTFSQEFHPSPAQVKSAFVDPFGSGFLKLEVEKITKQEEYKRLKDLVSKLADGETFKGLRNTPSRIIACCKKMADYAHEQGRVVDPAIQAIFIGQYKNPETLQVDLSSINNAAREELLATFLKMNAAVPALTDQSRKYMAQFYHLSPLKGDPKLEELLGREVVPALADQEAQAVDQLVSELGRALQTSIIELEGVDESTAQHSLQEFGVRREPLKMRALLDNWLRTSSGVKIPRTLLRRMADSAFDEVFSGKLHDQKIEAFKREFGRLEKEQQQKILNRLLGRVDREHTVDPDTLAPPARIFLLELQQEVQGFSTDVDVELRNFNQSLISKNDATYKLMGYAREISRLSRKWQRTERLDSDYAVTLIKSTLCYRDIDHKYFADKRKIQGFLKLETDSAEQWMRVYSDPMKGALSVNPEFPLHLENALKKPDPSYWGTLQKVLFKEGHAHLSYSKDLPGFICMGETIKIDPIYGVVYHNGTVRVDLPARLANHPDIRALGISHLPYTSVEGGGYCYLANIGGRPTPQVNLVEKEGKLIIQRNLPVSFSSTETSLIQFLPREALYGFPSSVLNRLGAHSFWMGERGEIYGYDKDGGLALILTKGGDGEWSVDTKDKKGFSFPKGDDEYRGLSEALKSFSADEVLIKRARDLPGGGAEPASVWVPAIDLLMKQEELPLIPGKTVEDRVIWKCEGQRFIGHTVQLDDAGSQTGHLTIRKSDWEEKSKEARAAVKELNDKLEALQAPEERNFLRRREAAQIKRELAETVKAWTTSEGRQVITLLPRKAEQRPIEDLSGHLGEDVENYLRDFERQTGEGSPIPSYADSDVFLRTVRDSFNGKSPAEYLLQKAGTPNITLLAFYKDVSGVFYNYQQFLYHTWQTSKNPDDRDSYLKIEKLVKILRARCGELIEEPVQAISLPVMNTTAASIAPRDLSSLLFLIPRLSGEHTREELAFILKKLGEISLQGPMKDVDLALLQEAKRYLDEQPQPEKEIAQLSLYLSYLEVEHNLYQIKKLALEPISDKKELVDKVKSSFEATLSEAARKTEMFADLRTEVTEELRTMWRKVSSSFGIEVEGRFNNMFTLPELRAVPSEKAAKHEVEAHFEALGSETLLQRWGVTSSVLAAKRDLTVEIQETQQDLMTRFKHSVSQREGFLLEDFGLFNEKTFLREFLVGFEEGENEQGLCGLKKSDVKKLWHFLQDKKWIDSEKGKLSFYFSVKEDPLNFYKFEEVRAHLAHLPLTEQELMKISTRLEGFLSRAAQARFSLTTTPEVDAKIDAEVAREIAVHEMEFNRAEHFLESELVPRGISMTEMTTAFITGDYSVLVDKRVPEEKCAALRNALVRNLFHKTEVQHLRNIQKAPKVGQRNKMELLNTKRGYPTDLLFKTPATAEEIAEQKLQQIFLVFEGSYGNRCNSAQVKAFTSLLVEGTDPDSVDAIQARMGFGKTVLLPLLALHRVAMSRTLPAEKRPLVRYVVPKAVLDDNTNAFNQKLSEILGSKIIRDPGFSRYHIDDEHKLESLHFIQESLKSRLSLYHNIRARGDVLIQWPEIRNSMEAQEEDFRKILLEGPYIEGSLEAKELLKCIKLLGAIRGMTSFTVFDELDDTQNEKVREVNYQQGDKVDLPLTRVLALEQMDSLVRAGGDFKDIKASAQAMLVAAGVTSFKEPVRAISSSAGVTSVDDELITYLTDKKAAFPRASMAFSVACRADPRNEDGHNEQDATLFLIRALLLDEGMREVVKNKQPNTHFGMRFFERDGQRVYLKDPVSGYPLLIGVPYEGTNMPTEGSVFDNTEVASIVTFKTLCDPETKLSIYPFATFLVNAMADKKIPEVFERYLVGVRNRDGKEAAKQLQEITELLDQEEKKIAIRKFYADFMENPEPGFRRYLAAAVVAIQIKSGYGNTKSNRYEMGSLEDVQKGCSGTGGEDTSSYFARSEKTDRKDPAAEGKIVFEIIARKENSPTVTLAGIDPAKSYLEQRISSILDAAKENTRALIDVAGMCKSREGTPEAVVEELWKQLKRHGTFKDQDIQGIIYYGRDSVKRLFVGPGKPPVFPCTQAMELEAAKGNKYFAFYPQKNTRGSDIKFGAVHGMVLMDPNVDNSSTKQAVLRLRSLVDRNSGQSFTFALTPELAALARGKETTKPVTSGDVANYLRLKEKAAEEKNSVGIFVKELNEVVHQAASHLEHDILLRMGELTPDQEAAYRGFLREREAITPFVELSINTLIEKYGQGKSDLSRDEYIRREMAKAKGRLEDLFFHAGTFANACREEISLDLDSYMEYMDRSERLFKRRYPEDKAVNTLGAGSTNVSTAEAAAQAEQTAAAEAEAAAEELAQNEVQAEERLPLAGLKLSKKEHVRVDLSKTLTSSMDLKAAAMEHLVHPARGVFKVSPHVVASGIVSHFIAYQEAEGWIIFISQEEADQFLKVQERGGYAGIMVIDARDEEGLRRAKMPDEFIRDIQTATMRNNGVMEVKLETLTDTKALGNLSLTNVNPEQLLPTLTLRGDTGDVLTPKQYGIGLNGEVNISVSKQDNPAAPVAIRVDGIELLIPRTNGEFNKFLEQAQKAVAADPNNKSLTEELRTSLNHELGRVRGLGAETFASKIMQANLDMKSRIDGLLTGDVKDKLEKERTSLLLDGKRATSFYSEAFVRKVDEIKGLLGQPIPSDIREMEKLYMQYRGALFSKEITDMRDAVIIDIHGGQIAQGAEECRQVSCSALFKVVNELKTFSDDIFKIILESLPPERGVAFVKMQAEFLLEEYIQMSVRQRADIGYGFSCKTLVGKGKVNLFPSSDEELRSLKGVVPEDFAIRRSKGMKARNKALVQQEAKKAKALRLIEGFSVEKKSNFVETIKGVLSVPELLQLYDDDSREIPVLFHSYDSHFKNFIFGSFAKVLKEVEFGKTAFAAPAAPAAPVGPQKAPEELKQEKIAELEEAIRFAEQLGREEKRLEDVLGKKGMLLAEPGKLLSIFTKEALVGKTAGQKQVTLQGRLPDFEHVVDNMEKYSQKIPLGESEGKLIERSKEFFERLKKLASQLEPRQVFTLSPVGGRVGGAS